MNVPTWSAIRTLGDSKILKSAYFWLLFVPIVVKALARTTPLLTFTWAGTTHTLDLSLPFSWQVFFYAALVTSVANLIYALRCPWIVKRFHSHADYAAEGRGVNQIREQMTELGPVRK